jgi:hypothetical protein
MSGAFSVPLSARSLRPAHTQAEAMAGARYLFPAMPMRKGAKQLLDAAFIRSFRNFFSLAYW